VKSNIRWSCQSKRIAYAFFLIAFRPVLRALEAEALACSSNSNAHYGCDWRHGISLCSARNKNKSSFNASHLILNAVIG
jgi:hypothetical protein